MGISGSKPDWYPGEPTNIFNAPPCSCGEDPHATGGGEARASAGAVTAGVPTISPPISSKTAGTAVTSGREGGRVGEEGIGGGGLNKTKGEREITSLPVVELTDSKVHPSHFTKLLKFVYLVFYAVLVVEKQCL